MIKVNFKAYSNYITDSLYQWDINQPLTIHGLNIATAPEIHFANANMDRAIVRQSTLEGGVVTVMIPNSLLQEALTIRVHVGIYEGETFKVIEQIEIPVKPKARPYDYTFTDSDEEIYSFNSLENLFNTNLNESKKAYSDATELCNEIVENFGQIPERVDDLEKWVDDVTNSEIDIFQRPWNVDDNVGQINSINGELSLKVGSSSTETKSFGFKMINSGNIYLSFCHKTSISNSAITAIKVLKNDTEITTVTSTAASNTELILLNVSKNDIITIQVTYTNSNYSNSVSIDITKILLLANIDTPYKYLDLQSGTSISAHDIHTAVIDTLLGVTE